MTKTVWCFSVQTAIHLQNVYAKFHKVVYRHYLDDVENVHISVWQIYSGQYVVKDMTQTIFSVYNVLSTTKTKKTLPK